jgi:hypothetical protein
MNGFDKFHIYRIGFDRELKFGEGNKRVVYPEQVGSWFTIELNINTGHVIFDFKKERI